MKLKKSRLAIIFAVIFILVVAIYVIFNNGLLLLNGFNVKGYPVRGIDVSEYQGKIDWDTISNQGLKFAYIKATEGSKYTDKQFKSNWEYANKTNMKIGAYHFLSFDSDGATQADNFIKNVPEISGLPPAVDIELYGKYKKDNPSKQKVHKVLNSYLNKVENYYKVKPVLYFTEKSFKLYYDDEYSDYMVWVRNVYTKPDFKNWTFWQYADKGRLKGYSGQEKFIDLDVFNGNDKDFERTFE